MGTLKQVMEALQPLHKLLELINPRYESELRHTFEQGRLNRVTNVAGVSMSFSAVKATAVSVGPAGGYLNAQGTAGNLVLPSETARHGTQSLRSNPGIAKGLRRARDEHGGKLQASIVTIGLAAVNTDTPVATCAPCNSHVLEYAASS